MEEEASRRWLEGGSLPWYVAGSQLLGVASVVITGVWMGHYRGGYAWDGSRQEFNVHPLCMVLGMIFLYGDGKPEGTLSTGPELSASYAHTTQ